MRNASDPKASEKQLTATGQRPAPGFELTLKSEESAVRVALGDVVSALKTQALSDEEIGTVELVLAEVLNNVVEHAYPGSDRTGQIHVSGQWHRNGLHVEVRDRGAPMPDGKLPIGTLPAVDVDLMEMPEGGFGWFLIQDLAKDVVYCRDEPDNLLRFRMAILVD